MPDLLPRRGARASRTSRSASPSLLVGNHSGGLLIADTFVFSAALLRPLRARPALPPARPRRRRQEPAAGPDPALRRRPRLARQRARGLRPRRAGARLPRRRLRDVPPQLALRPDRVRRPPGLHQARARAGRPDRAGGRDRRPGDRAVPHPRRARREADRARQAHAHQGAAGLDRPAARRQPPRPPGPHPAPGQDQGPGAAADRPARALRRRPRPGRGLRGRSRPRCRTRSLRWARSGRSPSSAERRHPDVEREPEHEQREHGVEGGDATACRRARRRA